MHFASAALLALFWGGHAEPARHPPAPHLWLESAARPTPLAADVKPPIELKSIKVVGATGLGAFIPIADDVGLGAGVTTFRIAPGQRAMQFVAAIRFRF
jgi:hypothetical protein